MSYFNCDDFSHAAIFVCFDLHVTDFFSFLFSWHVSKFKHTIVLFNFSDQYLFYFTVTNTTRFISRGCVDGPDQDLGCTELSIRFQFTYYLIKLILPVIPFATGIESGSVCNCESNVCNNGVTWQPTTYLIVASILCIISTRVL